jgi:hypothetical protein
MMGKRWVMQGAVYGFSLERHVRIPGAPSDFERAMG